MDVRWLTAKRHAKRETDERRADVSSRSRTKALSRLGRQKNEKAVCGIL